MVSYRVSSCFGSNRTHSSCTLGLCILLTSFLVSVCHACEPGPAQLAKWFTRDLNLSQVPLPNKVTTTKGAASDNTTTVFHNGSIVTMAGGTYSPVDALVVRGDKILFTGSYDDAKQAAGSDAVTNDLNGQALLPGFVEPHLHLILTALADNYLLKMSPLIVSTLKQAQDVLKDAIANNQLLNGTDGTLWAAGYGYDPSRVDDHPDLTIDVLDAISTEIAIYVLNQSGHVAYANSLALKAANVTAASVAGNPQYQKAANGSLTGVLFEQAVQHVGSFVPQPSAPAIIGYCKQTLEKWISLGCTTVFDAGIGSVGTTDFAIMSAVPSTGLRIHGALSGLVLTNLAPVVQSPPFKLGTVEVTSIKFWADGSTQGFTAAVTEPYLHPPPEANPYGVKNYNDSKTLATAMQPWLNAGFQLVVHSNGDAASDIVLDAYEKIFAQFPQHNPDIIHRIEHFTVTRPEQLQQAKSLNLSVSHTIGHVNYWGSTFEQYVLGDPRALNIDPLRNDTDIGLLWSVHSDSPVTDVNPPLYLKTATTRQLYPPANGTLGNMQQVDLQTALRAITINPATQLGVADIVGTLEQGKMADMVVLDQDPRNVDLFDLDHLKVKQTWIGGEMVYSADA